MAGLPCSRRTSADAPAGDLTLQLLASAHLPACLQAKEEDVHKLLSPHGTVWQLTMPRKPDGAHAKSQSLPAQFQHVLTLLGAAGACRGFAFAAMACRADAARAIAAANGQVRRPESPELAST